MASPFKHFISLYILLLFCLLTACDDSIVWEEYGSNPTESDTSGIYILCEGLINMNNSTISFYDFQQGRMHSFQDDSRQGSDKTSYDFFKMQNKRRLGDTANALQRYGDKIWCAVNVSSRIEVLEVNSGLSLKQIPVLNESGVGRQPRKFAFSEGKAYLCNFDGTVMRIDTTTFAVEQTIQVGRNPDGICVANAKLYVANSGGLDSSNPDNTVSVIDLTSFKEIKRITVRNNLGTILADRSGNVYVTSREKFNYDRNDYDCRLHRIDTEKDEVMTTYDLPILDFTISGYKAYMYSYDSKNETVKVMDTRTGVIVDEDFIKDPIAINCIYNISVNPFNEEVYICDAQNYVINGSVHCFTPQGKHRFSLDAKGINPNAIVFTATTIDDTPEEPTEPGEKQNSINRVFEYRPAPGQFVNQAPQYETGDGEEEMLNKCLQAFDKGSMISLGGYGGYITVGFNRPIRNIPTEYDFRILGNAFEGSAEPGIVLVSCDTNNDGLPNDEWYELKGSEYDNPATVHNYTITYHAPEVATASIHWEDNKGGSGTIGRTIHAQSYYPLWLDEATLTFTGSLLPDNSVYDTSLGKWIMNAYPYGYADNHSNSHEGSKFKIEWAIDHGGNPVHLEQIDFVRIYTAVNRFIPGVGELSTEIKGIEDLNTDK